MAIGPGSRLGPYEVTALIGEGGMGKVWRAHHTGLRRDDALKVLPDAFAADPERLARFQREAQVLASLNHPNIAHVHGLERSDGVQALVMELVEGPTLADRIAQGAIPIDEALPIAKQIAEALEAAHEQGIIHRDLKPANIKVRPDGTVKVLDFGLAKALELTSSVGADVTASPTITSPAMMTGIGVLLGTAAYMSPEQARGKALDRRTDIWAFGAVLYEIFTGRRAFPGEDVADVLVAVLSKEPDWTVLPPDTPEFVRRLLRRLLQRDRRRRLADIADARLEIEEGRFSSAAVRSDGTDGASPAPRASSRLAWVAAAALGVVAAGLAVALVVGRPNAPGLPGIRVEITTPQTSDPMSLAVSPDGRSVAFVGIVEGRSQILVRSLDSPAAQPLDGTVNGTLHFWSPDGGSLGFFADAKLKTIDIDTGLVTTLADATTPQGGTWGADGAIVYVPALSAALTRIASSGGQPTVLRNVGAGQQSHKDPRFLPDGRHYLYFVRGGDDVRGVYVGGLDGLEPRRLLDGDTGPAFVVGGYLFFVRQESLFAQPFDSASLAPSGKPVLLAQGVGVDGSGRAAFAVSGAGVIAYRGGAVLRQKQLAWFDRGGKQLGVAGGPGASHTSPTLSPDGRHVAMHQTVGSNVDIWLFDLQRDFPSRFTANPLSDIYPVWSPDGDELVFSTFEEGRYNLYRKRLASGGSQERLFSSADHKLALDWSRDGRLLLYRQYTQNTRDETWALPMDGDRKAFRAVESTGNVPRAQLSPDGRWLAYESDESGRSEVYVQRFPGPGPRTQVSTDGGAQVRWRPDGRELFYIDLTERLVAVAVTASSGDTLGVGASAALFRAHLGAAVPSMSGPLYMVSPDGQRFLMDTVVDEGPPAPISLILNWHEELKRLVPTN